ncbi:nuclear transport factor 2 family protein [Streptomyces sp. NPDC048717]|uniref:nuclear transport factor 2 family protein n=1 Tax=Streptomyces sp. NPDC048717 TaxID=3154928 RepID=UPI003433FEA9
MSSPSSSVSADLASIYRAIENLVARYAELVDDGDFTGLGLLLANATFSGGGAPVHGRNAIEQMFRNTLVIHDDGTPRTHHVTSNIAIEIDERTDTAVARSYVTVLQALPDLPLQTIAAGRYRDRFEHFAGSGASPNGTSIYGSSEM